MIFMTICLIGLDIKKEPSWLDALDSRAPKNVVVVAMANKLARIAWAVLQRQRLQTRRRVTVRKKTPAAWKLRASTFPHHHDV
ncbi:MAG: transposase family protein [Edaphobacter sp.]|nr:transposase family protein [Edaphobacter sp.]